MLKRAGVLVSKHDYLFYQATYNTPIVTANPVCGSGDQGLKSAKVPFKV